MSGWRKHFKIWDPEAEKTSTGQRGGASATSAKFASWLQEVYTGQPNRTDRYVQYDQMDIDSEVNAALDTIAEFCTQSDIDTNLPFRIMWKEDPTESESKEELDRFCDAMLSIREEIREIENGTQDAEVNVLKNAPHTASEVIGDNWSYSYSREKAAFPLPYVKANKFWPTVARVNSTYGDRNLICACIPVEAYA